jgi:hypothetical protein
MIPMAEYFIGGDYTPATLLRSADGVDEAFVDGSWRPTTSITDWRYGEGNLVEEISEAAARRQFPAAFK